MLQHLWLGYSRHILTYSNILNGSKVSREGKVVWSCSHYRVACVRAWGTAWLDGARLAAVQCATDRSLTSATRTSNVGLGGRHDSLISDAWSPAKWLDCSRLTPCVLSRTLHGLSIVHYDFNSKSLCFFCRLFWPYIVYLFSAFAESLSIRFKLARTWVFKRYSLANIIQYSINI